MLALTTSWLTVATSWLATRCCGDRLGCGWAAVVVPSRAAILANVVIVTAPPLSSRLRCRWGHLGRSADRLSRTGAGRGPRFGSTADTQFGRQCIPVTGSRRRLGAGRRLLPGLCGLRWAGRSGAGRFVGGRSSERFGERGPGIVRIVIRHGRFQRRAGGGDGGTPSGNVDSRVGRIHQPARSWQALSLKPGRGRKRPRKAGFRGRGDQDVRAGAIGSGRQGQGDRAGAATAATVIRASASRG